MNNETNAIKDTDRNVRANERARQINELRRLDTFNESLGNWNEMVESTVAEANKAIDESKTQTQSAQAAEAQRQSTFNTKLIEWDSDAATHIAASEKATADANEAAENAKNVTDAAAANANTAASNAQSVANTIQRKLDNGEFKGADGKTPVRGVDYWTTADRAPIEQATSAANTAAASAGTAASNAEQAASETTAAKNAANTAAGAANAAKTSADAAAANANAKATTADAAANAANTAKSAADTAATNANTAASNANQAATNANTAANHAEDVASSLSGEIADLRNTKADKKQTDRTEARLDIVESILAEGDTGWTLDSQESYEHVIPSNLIKVRDTTHGFVDLVGIEGQTVKWNQLNSIPDGSTGSQHGITATMNGNIITYSGTPTDGTYVDIYSDNNGRVKNSIVVGHKYLAFMNDTNKASADGNQLDRCVYLVENFSGYREINGGYGYILTATQVPTYYFVRIQVANHIGERISGTARVDLIDLTAIFGPGNEPTNLADQRIECVKRYAAEHPEYNPGQLVSADVRAVESVGKNLLELRNGFSATSHGIAWVISDNAVSAHGTTTDGNGQAVSFDIGKSLVAGNDYTISIDKPINMTVMVMEQTTWRIMARISAGSTSATFTMRDTSNEIYVSIAETAGTVVSFDGLHIQLERGTTATPYSPYGIKESIDLPALDLKSAGSVRDRADFLDDVVKRNVGVVDLGSFAEWRYYNANPGTTNERVGIDTADVGIKASASTEMPNILCHKYMSDTAGNTWVHKSDKAISIGSNGNVLIYDSELIGKTQSQIKAALTGVLLYFELAEPIEEPLTVPKSYIQAEPGGSIRFAQPDGTMPVPHAIQYPVNRREALNA